MIGEITPHHHAKLLQMNREFVHWLSPMNRDELLYVLGRATYARQVNGAEGVLIGYAHDVDYPDHWNMAWLSSRFQNFFILTELSLTARRKGKAWGRPFMLMSNPMRDQGGMIGWRVR